MKSIVENALSKAEMGLQEPDKELERVLEGLKTDIKVIGCGGGGSNTIQRMEEEGITGAELFALNTDAQHLLYVNTKRKMLIGRRRTHGLGAGSIPQIGEDAARETEDEVREMLESSDMVFITCGLGGGTGTGAAPVVAEAAKAAGALTIAVVTLPFNVEGVVRMANADAGLERLREMADTVIVIPNDKLLEIVPQLPLYDAFKVADEVLMRAVKGITELITRPGLVNLDFADVRTIMQRGGVAMIGLGESDGQDKAIESVNKALKSPLLDVDISDASSALVNITGGPDMTMGEAGGVVEEIYRRINQNARLIWGAQVDPNMSDTIRTMIVVTGVKSPQIYGKPAYKGVKRAHGIDFMR